MNLSNLYIPRTLTFKSEAYFGKEFNKKKQKNLSCYIQSMIFSGKINFDGTIDESLQDKIPKYELWLYIYYLWSKNKDILDVFASMSREDQPSIPSSYNFVRTVMLYLNKLFNAMREELDRQGRDTSTIPSNSTLFLSVNELITFINSVITENLGDTFEEQTIRLPIVKETFDKLEQALIKKEEIIMKKLTQVDQSFDKSMRYAQMIQDRINMNIHAKATNTSTGESYRFPVNAFRKGSNVNLELKF